MTTHTVTRSELAGIVADLFGPQVVTVVAEITAPENGALVFWNDATNEGLVIQPLYTDKDRAAMRRRMLAVVEEQGKRDDG